MTLRRRRIGGPGRTLKVPSTDWTLVRASPAVVRQLLVRQCPALPDRAAVAASKVNQQVAGHLPNLIAVASINIHLAILLINHPLLATLNNNLATLLLLHLANTPPSQHNSLAIIAVVRISHPQATGLDRKRNPRYLLLVTGLAVTADLSHTVAVPLASHCLKSR